MIFDQLRHIPNSGDEMVLIWNQNAYV